MQLNELVAAYKKAHKVELADQIDKKCSGDLKALMLAKLGVKGENFHYIKLGNVFILLELAGSCLKTSI